MKISHLLENDEWTNKETSAVNLFQIQSARCHEFWLFILKLSQKHLPLKWLEHELPPSSDVWAKRGVLELNEWSVANFKRMLNITYGFTLPPGLIDVYTKKYKKMIEAKMEYNKGNDIEYV